ncbi:resolvase, N terminal domain protein, partial [Candidatus Erwinia dacicola]
GWALSEEAIQSPNHQANMVVMYGYARVSTNDQDLALQTQTLRDAGCEIIRAEKASGASRDMLGVFAEFETNLRRERQLEGIAAANVRGVYRGRKPSIDPTEVHRLYVDEKMGATAIARKLGICRASVYRALRREPETACRPPPRSWQIQGIVHPGAGAVLRDYRRPEAAYHQQIWSSPLDDQGDTIT